MHAVIIGPGRLGCGYLTPLFREAGWEVTLVARSPASAARIRARGRFTAVEVPTPIDPEGTTDRDEVATLVTGYDVVAIGSPGFNDAIARADLVCTSVGVGNVLDLAGPLAEALVSRPADRPLDIWTVENGDVAGRLEAAMRRRFGAWFGPLPEIGVAGAVATVAVSAGDRSPASPAFVGDDHRLLIVDETALRTPLPRLPGVRGTTRHRRTLDAKLHVFNAGHAICAYLGRLRGHTTIDLAVADRRLRPIVAGAMLESARCLASSGAQEGTAGHSEVAHALRRFANPTLADPVTRVGRDPLRKLGRDDRLIGPLRRIHHETGRVPTYFALGVAGALLYRADDDVSCNELQGRLADDGLDACLASVCGLSPDDPEAGVVAGHYRGFVFDAGRAKFPPPRIAGPVLDLVDLEEHRS